MSLILVWLILIKKSIYAVTHTRTHARTYGTDFIDPVVCNLGSKSKNFVWLGVKKTTYIFFCVTHISLHICHPLQKDDKCWCQKTETLYFLSKRMLPKKQTLYFLSKRMFQLTMGGHLDFGSNFVHCMVDDDVMWCLIRWPHIPSASP